MKTSTLIATSTLTRKDIDTAMDRAHDLRSDAAWSFMSAVKAKIAGLFHSTPSSNVSGGTGLAAS